MPQHEIELLLGWDDVPDEIAAAVDRLREELGLLDFVRLERPVIPSEFGIGSGAAVAS